MDPLIRCAVVLAVLAGSAGAAAGAEDLVVVFTDGARALQEHRWTEADADFTRVLARWPAQADALALSGMARYHLGRYRDAEHALREAIDRGTRYEARSLYYLGLALTELHDNEAARDAFAELADRYPRSPETAQIAALAPAAAPLAGCSALALLSMTWDSSPRRYTAGPGLSHADPDWFAFCFASLTVPIPESPIDFKALFSGTDYLASDDIDLYTMGAEIAGHIASDAASFAPRYAAQVLWLDGGEFFAIKHQVSLAWREDWGAGISSEAVPAFSINRYGNRYNGLDGEETSLHCEVAWNARDHDILRRVALIGGVDNDLAYASYEGWLEWEAGLGVRFDGPWRTSLDLATSVRDRAYRAAAPDHPTTVRDDLRWDQTAIVTRPLGRWVHAQLTVSHANNDSSVGEFSYHQWLAGVGIIVSY